MADTTGTGTPTITQAQTAAPTGAPTRDATTGKFQTQQAQPTGAAGSVDKVTAGSIGEAAQEAMRRLKIDDQEIDEAEVIKVYKERKGHQSAANKILQEGKSAKKQAEEFISMMKDKGKLFDVIKKLGHDPRQLSEEYLASILEEEVMDPRDRELKQTKLKLQELEEMDKKQKQAVEDQRNQVLKEKYAKDFNEQFVKALGGSGLPPTKETVAAMAKYVSRSASMGFKMTPDEAAQLVRQDLENTTRSIIGQTDGELLIKMLGGDEVVNKIRKYDTSRLKSPEDMLRTPEVQAERKPRSPGARRMSPREWREFNRK